MTQLNDIEIFIEVDGEEFSLEENLTVGRHLNNDLIVAGEDVLDYHLRLQATSRGLRAHPLGEATLTVNGATHVDPRGLLPGDCLIVGQSELRVGARPLDPPAVSEWSLQGVYGREPLALDQPLTIGRGDDCDVLLMDDHISRQHAKLVRSADVVWLQDLDSANGTFVNGQRVVGGCRLFHGDLIKLDMVEFQLIGKGDELTPVRADWNTAEHALMKPAPQDSDTTEIAVAVAEDEPAPDSVEIPEGERGAFLLGAGEPIGGRTFRLSMGRTVIGRSDECDVVIKDRTVSLRHVELILRPEGCTLTNLMATNGSRINGREVQNAALTDGDVLRLGGVRLVFKDLGEVASTGGLVARAQWWLIAGSLLIAALLAWTTFVG